VCGQCVARDKITEGVEISPGSGDRNAIRPVWPFAEDLHHPLSGTRRRAGAFVYPGPRSLKSLDV